MSTMLPPVNFSKIPVLFVWESFVAFSSLQFAWNCDFSPRSQKMAWYTASPCSKVTVYIASNFVTLKTDTVQICVGTLPNLPLILN